MKIKFLVACVVSVILVLSAVSPAFASGLSPLSPTATPAPTETVQASPALKAGMEIYTVTASSLNVRSKPSSSATRITVLSRNTQVYLLENVGKGWYKILLKDKRVGYASGAYLKHTGTYKGSATPSPTPTPKPEDEMEVAGSDYGQKVLIGVNEVREIQGVKPLTYGGQGDLLELCKKMAKGGKLTAPRGSNESNSNADDGGKTMGIRSAVHAYGIGTGDYTTLYVVSIIYKGTRWTIVRAE